MPNDPKPTRAGERAKDWSRKQPSDAVHFMYEDGEDWIRRDEVERQLNGFAESRVHELQAWKDAVIDAAVVNWTFTKEHENNPRLAIAALLAQAQKEALDPVISKEAAEWEAANAGLQAQVKALTEVLERCERRLFLYHQNDTGAMLLLASIKAALSRVPAGEGEQG